MWRSRRLRVGRRTLLAGVARWSSTGAAPDPAFEEDFGAEPPGAGPAKPAKPASKPAEAGAHGAQRPAGAFSTFFGDEGVAAPEANPEPKRRRLNMDHLRGVKPPVTLRPGQHHKDSIRVPDRLRDSMKYFATDAATHSPDETMGHPKESRDMMMRNLISGHQNMYSHNSIDKVRIALEDARRKPHDSSEWRTVWTFLRTMHFCCELVREPYDKFPEADKLYVDLEANEDRRRPYVWELEDGTVVLPIFSLEEYIGHYFQRCKVFESQWFPVPRMGKCFDEYKKMDFPVLGHGGIHHMAGLATMSTPHQFLLCVNPTQPACKFLTYPEMVQVAEASKRNTRKGPRGAIKRENIDGSLSPSANPNRGGVMDRVDLAKEQSVAYTHDPTLHRIFDSTGWIGKRKDPVYLPPPDPRAEEDGVIAPPIATAELKLLVFDVPALRSVHLATIGTGDGRKRQAVAVVDADGEPSAVAAAESLVRERLSKWSYTSEAEVPVEVVIASSAPVVGQEGVEAVGLVYTDATVGWMRDSLVEVRKSVREQLGYDDTL